MWLARVVIGVYGVVALTFFFARRTEDGPGPGLFFKCCPLAGYLSCVFRCLERGTGMCTGGIVPHLDETQNRPFWGVSWAVFKSIASSRRHPAGGFEALHPCKKVF